MPANERECAFCYAVHALTDLLITGQPSLPHCAVHSATVAGIVSMHQPESGQTIPMARASTYGQYDCTVNVQEGVMRALQKHELEEVQILGFDTTSSESGLGI